MTYSVHEIFLTIQGEGVNTGRLAVFCRFAGCNLWTGREVDRRNAICWFCDTEFVGVNGPGGGKFHSSIELATAVERRWPADSTSERFIVLTGGEPLLQLDASLLDALHAAGFEVAIETNGTLSAPDDLDWICVSPKAGAPLRQRTGDELKFVYPQGDFEPAELETLEFKHFLLQPRDGPDLNENIASAARYCAKHPHWRLSLQSHKLMGIP